MRLRIRFFFCGLTGFPGRKIRKIGFTILEKRNVEFQTKSELLVDDQVELAYNKNVFFMWMLTRIEFFFHIGAIHSKM